MSVNRPVGLLGLRHAAIQVNQLHAAESFYVDLLGYTADRRPSYDSVYLTKGNDLLTLHQFQDKFPTKSQRLSHLGFAVESSEDVDAWHRFLSDHQVKMGTDPIAHRDGGYSFWCYDPDGNVVQVFYQPKSQRLES